MKRRWLSILAALALCLGLLPGTAWAEGDTGVSISVTALESGKQYVAGGYGVIEKPADAPADTPYLDYRDGVLTVHGQMDLKSSPFSINGAVTFTGGGDSCLETANIYINGTLTLSGSMDFKPKSLNGNSSASPATKLTTTDDYSGDIAIQGTSTSVLLDVQSSASISIGGNVSYYSPNTPVDPITLKSAGDISTNMLQYHTITIEGKNVSLMHSPVFTGKSLTVKAAENVTVPNCAVLFLSGSGNYTEAVSVDISAGGNVEITNNGILMQTPPDGRTDSLTIRDAKSVSIQGKTNEYNPSLLPVSVTFVNCGSVTVTDTGTGEILKEGVPVTSDCPWTATAGGKTVTIPSGTWTYGGDAPTDDPYFLSNVSCPTCYKAGEGWMFYEPPASEGAPAKLILDGASYNGRITIQKADSVQLELKGENTVKKLGAGALTLTGNGGFEGTLETGAFTNNSTATLNAVVVCPERTYTVYGNRSTADFPNKSIESSKELPLTIANGATLTILQDGSVSIYDLEGLKNHGTIVNQGDIVIAPTGSLGTPNFGTIVNNGGITIYPTVDITGEEMSAFIKGLGLTGTGTVTVQKTVNGSTVTENYTHSGLKLLEPAGTSGTLDLSTASTPDENRWNDQGYKWTDVVTDETSGNITSAKLTLAKGFNAETVKLPETGAIEIVTLGEASIKTLICVGSSPNAQLTFSEAGPLTITERINIAGGDNNSFTVEAGANVIANEGIYIGASGGVNSLITVNGTLTSKGITAGSVAIGNTGVLNVSGTDGVLLNGMPKNTDAKFKDLFTVAGNGRFTAECSEYNIRVSNTNPNDYPSDLKEVINLAPDYWPENCEPKRNGNDIDLWNTKTDRVYSGKMIIHQNHTYPNTWEKDDSEHWKECTYEGCGKRSQVGAHVYDGDWDAECNTCGYTRSVSHTHSYGADWQYDDNQHWKQCACGQTAETGEHVYDDDRDEACNICGYQRTIVTPPEPSEPSDGSGGRDDRGSSVSTYAVTVEKAEHGEVTSNRARASGGSTVTLTVTPEEGCALDALTVTDSRGNEVKLTEESGRYTFTMPERAVTVKAVFAPLPEEAKQPCDGGAECPSRSFADLERGAWYHEAVDYVLERGLMGGHGNGLFGPNDTLTRAQFAQILYNQAGRPAVTGNAPFTDVSPDAWYAPAAAWAAEQGVIGGYGGGLFGPEDPITREQLAVMLWRYAGSPAAPDGELAFTDAEQMGAYAREALRWAVLTGVMNGKGGGVLDPKGLATRAQTASVLRNFLENG